MTGPAEPIGQGLAEQNNAGNRHGPIAEVLLVGLVAKAHAEALETSLFQDVLEDSRLIVVESALVLVTQDIGRRAAAALE
jgi:hypothetical protein